MTMLEYWVGSFQDLFPGNCARSVKGEEAQAPQGGSGPGSNPGPSNCKAEGLAITL